MENMTVTEFLALLRGQGIKLRVEGERLRYRGPSATLTPEIHAAIAARKAELLAALQQEQKSQELRPAQRDFPPPLSFAQQRLWFLDQLQPNSAAYNIHSAIALTGSLDVARLERNFAALVARHEILRTTFVESKRGHADSRQTQPVQRIAPPEPLTIPLHDLDLLPQQEQAQEVRRRALAEAQQPFDLAHGPLLRAVLLRLGPAEHVLLLTMHHIISDGWSIGVLVRELTALYAAGGAAEVLPPLPIQYADYAIWQRERLTGEALESLLAYWREQLQDAPTFLELPIDRPRPALQTLRGASLSTTLDPALTAALKSLSQQAGATLFMTLLAAFKILLARHSAQEHIVVGTPIAGRTHKELEGLIGFFVNTLALHTDLSGNPSFIELLGRVRTMALDAFAHQELPFEQLIDALHLTRDLSRQPLVQAMFSMQNTPIPELELPGLALRPLPVEQGFAKFDLTLTASEERSELRLNLEYSTDLFDSATIERMLERFSILLRGIVANPGQRIVDLPLLTAAEQHQISHQWNATAVNYPRACLHDLVAAQATRTPDAPALIFEGAILSYAELDRRANQLAHHLQALGVGPDARVGICLTRSPELMIALLGVLKAGGGFVPLDPDFPQERLAFMLTDAQASALLTEEPLLPLLPAFAGSIVCLDRDRSVIAQQPVVAPEACVQPEHLAYLIYTSGSTGQPKGVMIEHRSLVNYLCWVNHTLFEKRVQWLPVVTKLTFDASLKQLLAPLLRGGTTWLLPRDSAIDPPSLAHALATRERVALNCVPSLWSAILEVLEADRTLLRGIRLTDVFVGGEQFSPNLVQRSFALLPQLRLWNLYGPTETTANASAGLIRDASAVTIGQPIANTRLYILDPHLRPQPVGVSGELYIGGAGLARGYQNRPDLTAEKFIPDPFSDHAGSRLYRTGDLARYRADGALEFVGRIDHQIKLRGFRIELGEIESVLRQHEAVRDLVVVLRDERLVAYVVGEQSNRVTNRHGNNEQSTENNNQEPDGSGFWVLGSSELRSFLQARLPNYMIPSAFVFLDTLPLMPNGKVDRQALPDPELGAGREAAFIAPATELERDIAEIWQVVLKVERVGTHDSFFDLGGHSLLATQVISRLRETLRVELPLRALFEAPTIAGISQRIQKVRQPAPRSEQPALQPVPRDGRLPLSFAQQRLWFLDQLEPGNPFYNIHAALEIVGKLDYGAVERSLNALVARHESLRTTFCMIDDQPAQVIAPSLQIALPLVDLHDLPPTEREAEALRLASEEAAQPFDLEHGPLLHARILRLEQQRQIVLLTIHHIISDGWSMGVLVRDLFAFYSDYPHAAEQIDSRAAGIPDLPIQYADFAVWQRRWLSGAVLDEQLAYWKQQLNPGDKGLPPTLELPTDRPRPAVLSYRGATQPFALPHDLIQALAQLSQHENVTLFMTLLAAFNVVLARYTGQIDIAVGSPIANRTRREAESLIGFFVNMLVLRTDLSGQPSARQLLARVRDICLGAYAHQDLPFEMLVEELQPERSLSYNPLFQVGFALQNMPMDRLELPGLQVRPINVVTRTATFDVSVFMHEEPQGIAGLVEYNTDLFDATTIERLIGHFSAALAAIAADPEQPITTLPLLTNAERDQLAAWNATAAPFEPRWVHELFEAQAMRTPDAIALVITGADERQEQIAYGDLNRRANQIARQLQALGAGPGVPVGLYVDRSPDLVAGLLGILKAGAAYVPLDPEYPTERLQFMLADAGAPILVTQERLVENLVTPTIRVLCLDRDQDAIAGWPEQNLGLTIAPDTLAYVIYTSGSTGQPKGVMVEQRQLANTLFASQRAFEFGPRDRMPCIASFSFDIALFELFCPLTVGGSAVLTTKQQILDLPRFARALEDVTVLHTLPSLMRQIAGFIGENSLAERYSSLRQVFVGGDAVAPDLLAEISSAFPNARINVLYGPTEATIICATHGVQRERIVQKHLIGKPMSNSTLRLYDQNQQPVPVGVPGELYIGGASVTRGYLNRPDLTAEKFVEIDGQRWYRSGDLARYLADGTLEFLGRIDQQVKIRGFRVELGEIETLLNEHPDVRDAVVIARADLPGDPRLVGYVVAESTSAASVAAQSSYVDDWQLLYDETYTQEQVDDPAFHIGGWHSSYTGEPFPPAEMREWRDATVDRIRALQPRRVLEIGCGTGLLLFPLAGECAAYHGIDFSAPALAHIRRHLPPEWSHVSLAQKRADELDDLLPGSFDMVIINSVAQYFPSVEYLVEVIARAAALLAPCGHIFVGDVRSRPLLDAFATAVTLAQAAPETPRETLQAQARQQVVQERELLLDPAFFYALRQALPPISAVQVEVKRGRAQNELTQFRYDVTLTVDGPAPAPPANVEIDWTAQGWTPDDLRAALGSSAGASLLVRRIPSARIKPLVQAVGWLQDAAGPQNAGELRAAIEQIEQESVEPESLWSIAEEHGYQARIGWSDGGADGCYDAVFSRSEAARLPEQTIQSPQPWSAYATSPAATRTTAEIAPRLRQYLQARLPEHMIPAAFVALEVLPLTPNGKVDRGALPAPVWTGGSATAESLPRTPTETTLAEIWQQVLGLPAAGIHDNFFALGGHSLLATQVVSRIRAIFGLDLPVRALFEHPTITELSAAVEAQSASQATSELPPLTRQGRRDPLPLSFAQQRLWFIEQLQGGTTTYHVSAAWEVRGPLAIDALQASLDLVIARHEALRTTFLIVDEQPAQQIAPPQSLPVQIIDLSALQAPAQERELERLLQRSIRQPFDLQRGPLLRPVLVRLAPDRHVFALTLHHIITDGWSMGVMINEIVAAYIAAVRQQPVNLPELPVQYADYAIWQRQWLQHAVLNQQLDYWRNQLDGVQPLQPPADHPRPPMPSHRGAGLRVELDAALVEQLRDLSQRTGTTLFMLLLTAWQILLARYSGQDDIAVGTPIAGRTRPEIEPLIGFFVNTLVLRTRIAGQPTFRNLLEQVRATTLDAYAHQDAPFEAIVEALQPERDTSRTPLFQVMFALSNPALPAIDLPEIQIATREQPATTSAFDLTLLLFDAPSGVTGFLEYALDLFETATIDRMLGHFSTLLAGIVANPDAPIVALPLLTAAEERQIVREWNRTARSFAKLPAHQLFEAQVARTPDATALVFEDRSLTYAELNCRANQLAHYLIGLGVGPEQPVAVCVERSIEMIVGVLGILKAGGAYLPLDPAYPAQRLQAMLQDSQATLLITQDSLLAQFPAASARIVCLDRDWPAINTQPVGNPRCRVCAENLVYLIYTSGSTGTPKGVLVTHGGLSNEIQAQIVGFGIEPDNRVLQFASLSFDAAASEIFIALTSGASLHLVSRTTILSLPELVRFFQNQAITNATLPPSMLALLPPDELPALQTVIVAGERFPAALARQWLGQAGDSRRLINGYGPTETTIGPTFHRLDDLPANATTVPIGQPFANVQVYVLDPQGCPVPVGVAGELFVGGAGVARGYINRPELTAERFVPDRFSQVPGSRLYRTGDLTRFLPDGTLEYIGRIDDQVKIRGFRVEPGEIENVLRQHEAVQDAVVVVRDERLVAYVVAAGPHPPAPSPTPAGEGEQHDSSPSPAAARVPSGWGWRVSVGVRAVQGEGLRAFLRQHLPDYMVPSAFVTLPALPKTINGKVDRRALPDPDGAASTTDGSYRAPRTPTEAALVETWQALLGVDRIGIDDNFFRLGGHSLLAIRLMEQIAARFGQRLPMAALFEDATIAHLAQCLEQHQTGEWSPLVAIQPHGSRPLLFCVHGLGGSAFNYVDLGRALEPDQPLYGLQAQGLDDDRPPHATIDEMAAAYVAAIRAQQPHGPYYLSGWSLGGVVAFEIAAMLEDRGEQVALLALLDSMPSRRQPAAGQDESADLLDVARMFGLEIADVARDRGQDFEAAAAAVLAQAQSQDPAAWQQLDPQQFTRIARLGIAHLRALDRYQPGVYSGPAVLIASADNPFDPADQRAAAQRAAWAAHMSADIEVAITPGTHWTMLQEPNVYTLADHLSHCLAEARTRSGDRS